MHIIKYIKGFTSNFFNPAVSLLCRIDEESKVNRYAKVYRGAQIYKSQIDSYSYVGVNSSVVYAEVGKFCSIGNNCICGLGEHTLTYVSTSPVFTERNNALGISWTKKSPVSPYKKLIIGNDVWIGTKAIIKGGIVIGDGAVVGAGAIVTKDVPPYAIVVGVPARIVGYRFSDDIISSFQEIRWWDFDVRKLRTIISDFQIPVSEDVIYDLQSYHNS